MKKLLPLLLLVIGLAQVGNAQKYLQMERAGKKKLIKYYLGDEITFRLKGEKIDYTLPIKDLDQERGVIVFANGEVKIEDIAVVRRYLNRRSVRAWTLTFVNFGAAWGIFTLIDVAVGGSFTVGAAIVTGASMGLGVLIRLIFNKRKFKMNDRRQLRIIDLNVTPLGFPRPSGTFSP